MEIRYLADVGPGWSFTGVDPSPAMLDLARATAGPAARNRLQLIEGTVANAPLGPYDAATCILVLGLVPDDGGKAELLAEARRRLKPGATFILVDHNIDLTAPDAERRLDRYAAFARSSGVSNEVVAGARAALAASMTMVPAARNEALLQQAGFASLETFYQGFNWRGWVATA